MIMFFYAWFRLEVTVWAVAHAIVAGLFMVIGRAEARHVH